MPTPANQDHSKSETLAHYQAMTEEAQAEQGPRVTEQPRCAWAINFGGSLHTRCRWQVGHEGMHQGNGLAQFDYQRINWLAGDRREYETDRTEDRAWEGAAGQLAADGKWVMS